MSKRSFSAQYRKAVAKQDKIHCEECGADCVFVKRALWPEFPVLNAFSTDQLPKGYTSGERALHVVSLWLAHCDDVREQLRRFRNKLLERDDWREAYPWAAKLTRSDAFYHIDHKLALAEGGKDERANMQILCVGCHKAKTKEHAARAARRPVKKKTGVKL